MNVSIEIGDNLYLEIEGISYTKAEPMVRYDKDGSGYPGSPAEVDWSDDDCQLIYGETAYECPKGLADNYYDQILEATEEQLNDRSDI